MVVQQAFCPRGEAGWKEAMTLSGLWRREVEEWMPEARRSPAVVFNSQQDVDSCPPLHHTPCLPRPHLTCSEFLS